MKVAGWIFTILGALALLGSLTAVANGYDRNIGGPIVFLVLGIFFLSRARHKEKEKSNFDNWNNNVSTQK